MIKATNKLPIQHIPNILTLRRWPIFFFNRFAIRSHLHFFRIYILYIFFTIPANLYLRTLFLLAWQQEPTSCKKNLLGSENNQKREPYIFFSAHSAVTGGGVPAPSPVTAPFASNLYPLQIIQNNPRPPTRDLTIRKLTDLTGT